MPKVVKSVQGGHFDPIKQIAQSVQSVSSVKSVQRNQSAQIELNTQSGESVQS